MTEEGRCGTGRESVGIAGLAKVQRFRCGTSLISFVMFKKLRQWALEQQQL